MLPTHQHDNFKLVEHNFSKAEDHSYCFFVLKAWLPCNRTSVLTRPILSGASHLDDREIIDDSSYEWFWSACQLQFSAFLPWPPRWMGRVDCSQAISEMDERDNVSRQQHRLASKQTSSSLILFIGTVRMIWLSLQRPRQLWRRCSSTWGTSRSGNWSWQTSILLTLLETDEAKNESVPQIGAPQFNIARHIYIYIYTHIQTHIHRLGQNYKDTYSTGKK